MTKRSTAARGYGRSHQRLRKRWAMRVYTGKIPCARCGLLIARDEPWDLGHSDDRRSYTGPEHRACNRGARPGVPRLEPEPKRVTRW